LSPSAKSRSIGQLRGEEMTIKRDISNVAPTNGSTIDDHVDGESGEVESLDMLIVGGGFAGVWLIRRLRERGFHAKIVEVDSLLLLHRCQILTARSLLMLGGL